MKKSLLFVFICSCGLMLTACGSERISAMVEDIANDVEAKVYCEISERVGELQSAIEEDASRIEEEQKAILEAQAKKEAEEKEKEEQEEKKPSSAEKYWEIINNHNQNSGIGCKVEEPYYIEDAPEAFVEALNKEREALGRHALELKSDGVLYKMATRRAKEIATDFRHTGGGGVECIQRTNDIKITPEESVADFKTSQAHWDILTSADYKYISVAFYVYTDGWLYVSVNMGGLIR